MLFDTISYNKTFITHPKNGFSNPEKDDDDHFTMVSHMKNTAKNEIVAKVAFVHGFAQCSDYTFLETAIQFALNGYEVWMCDLRGFGMSSGNRADKADILNMQRDVALMLQQIPSGDEPLYLFGHGMGSLVTESFLQINGNLSLSGLVQIAPFFGFH